MDGIKTIGWLVLAVLAVSLICLLMAVCLAFPFVLFVLACWLVWKAIDLLFIGRGRLEI